MTTQTVYPSKTMGEASERALSEAQEVQELMERLEGFRVRLEPGVLASVMALHDSGESAQGISDAMGLHPVVVELEVRRELQRRKDVPGLSVREWNALAAGTHVPSKQLRDMIDTAVRCRDGYSRTLVMRDAGITDSSHGHRLLGFKCYSEEQRPRETVTRHHAAAIARALSLAPVEVNGL
jgi:hypothetical protein